jgi:hypothetical protein
MRERWLIVPVVLLVTIGGFGEARGRPAHTASGQAAVFSSRAELVPMDRTRTERLVRWVERGLVALGTICLTWVGEIDLPLGLESRHLAAAAISRSLGAIAIVVSERRCSRVPRGEIEAAFIPELRLLNRHHAQLAARRVDEQPRSVWKC